MTPSPAQPPATAGATNYAPVEPLLKLRDNSNPRRSKVCDALRERFRHHLNLERQTWNEIYSVGHLVGLFIEGQQILRRDPFDGSWKIRPLPAETSTSRRAVNVMRWYATNQESKWLNSNPDVRVSPGAETDEAQAAAKAAGVIVDHYERQWYGPWFNREEYLHAAQWGTYVERVRYTKDRTSGVVYRQLFEQSEVTLGPGYASCADCGRHGAYADYVKPLGVEGAEGETAKVCPHCKSDAVFSIEPARERVSRAAGREAVPFGDIVCDIVPITSLRWDLKKRLEDSSWAIRRERTHLAAVKMKLGRVRLAGGEGDAGLDVIDALAYAGSSTDGRDTSKRSSLYREPVIADEYWLSPEDYCDIEVTAEEQTVGGVPLPAGNLAENFPGGLCVTGYNEMFAIDGIYGELHRPQFKSGVWHMRSLSGAGRGALADTVEVQKRFNTFDSDAVAFMGSTSTPATLYDKSAISREEAKHLFTPRSSIGVDMTKLPQEVKQLAHAVHQLPAGTMPAQFLDYVYNRLSIFAQLTSGVTAFSDGIPGADNKTATGARIGAAMSDAIYAPPFLVKGEVRQGIMERAVPLYIKHFSGVRRYFPPAPGRSGRARGVYLAGADLKQDLLYEVVEGSTLPRDSFFEQENREVFYGLFGGFPGYMEMKKAFPSEVAELERVFRIRDGHSADDADAVALLCMRRLEQMRAAAGSGVSDPAGLLSFIVPPVSTREPRHEEQRLWWQDWLVSDDGLDAPPALRAAAELMVDLHAGSGTLQMAETGLQQGIVETAAQAPGALGQAALAEEQAGQQQAQAQAELETQAAQVGLEQARQQVKAEGQREQSAVRQADREHALSVRKEAAQLQRAK